MSTLLGSSRVGALMTAAAFALIGAALVPALAKDKEATGNSAASAASAGKVGGAPTPTATKPRDQRRQADHRGSGDPVTGHGGRGAGPDHDIYPGSRLPSYYHNYRIYVVDDWRAHRLSAPPRGHHWVQLGADYALVEIVTGAVTRILVTD